MEKIAERVDEKAQDVVIRQVEELVPLVQEWVLVRIQELGLLLVVLLFVDATLLLKPACLSVLVLTH